MASNVEAGSMGPRGPMPSLVGWIDRLIASTAAAIIVGTLTVLFLSIFANVVLRYAFHTGLTWAYELPAILFPWLVVAGAVLAAQKGQHIAVQLVPLMVSPRVRMFLLVADNLAIVVMCGVVAKAGVPAMSAAADSHLAVTGVSEIWGYSSLVYGYVAMGLTAITASWRILATGKDGIEARPESAS